MTTLVAACLPPARCGAGSALIAVRNVALAIAWATLFDGCTRSDDQPLPADPKARAEFVAKQSASMSAETKRLLDRFMLRVKDQETAGGKAPTVSLSKGLDLQRTYDAEVASLQKRYQENSAAARADVATSVREHTLVADAKSPSGKSLRYVIDVNNTGKRVIERAALRVDFRDAQGKYLASVPSLELKGPLKPGEAGRTIQIMTLDPRFQSGLIDGRLAQVTVTPLVIAYADGKTLEPGKDLQALQDLARAPIP
jgi:hypothetical protein